MREVARNNYSPYLYGHKSNRLNDFAISTSGLATALQDSAGALTTAKVDFDQAVGIITAANAVLQSPEEVGKSVRTVALRLTGTKEAKEQLEAEGENVDDFIVETQSKLDESVKNLTRTALNPNGISLLDENNQYDIFNFLQKLADSWAEIGEQDKRNGTQAQNALLEKLAGKNRAAALSSLLEHPEILRNATAESANAVGSADEELDKYLTSIAAHQEKFTNSVHELINDLVSSGAINKIIDIGTGFINILDEITKRTNGLTGVIVGLITTVLTFAKGGELNGLFKFNFNADKDKGESVVSSPIFGGIIDKIRNRGNRQEEQQSEVDKELDQEDMLASAGIIESEKTQTQNAAETTSERELAAAKEQAAQASKDEARAKEVEQQASKKATAQNANEAASEDTWRVPEDASNKVFESSKSKSNRQSDNDTAYEIEMSRNARARQKKNYPYATLTDRKLTDKETESIIKDLTDGTTLSEDALRRQNKAHKNFVSKSESELKIDKELTNAIHEQNAAREASEKWTLSNSQALEENFNNTKLLEQAYKDLSSGSTQIKASNKRVNKAQGDYQIANAATSDLAWRVPDVIPDTLKVNGHYVTDNNKSVADMRDTLAKLMSTESGSSIDVGNLYAELDSAGNASGEVLEKFQKKFSDVMASISDEDKKVLDDFVKGSASTGKKVTANAEKSANKIKGTFSGLGDGLKAGIKSLGSALLSGFVNFGIGLAIGFVVQKLGELIEWLDLTGEHAKETAASLHSVIETQKKDMASAKALIESSGERFIELQNGVNSLGENVALSNEDYAEYVKLSEQLADTFPELVKGYNSLNEPILKNIDNVKELNKLIKEQELLNARQNIYGKDENGKENFDQVIKSFDTQANVAQENFLKELLASDSKDFYLDYLATNPSDYKNAYKRQNKQQRMFATIQRETGIDYVPDEEYFDLKAKNENGTLADDEVNRWNELKAKVEETTGALKAYYDKVKQTNDMQTDYMRDAAQNYVTILGTSLNEEQTQMAKMLAGNLSSEFFDNLTGDTDAKKSQIHSAVQEIIELVQNENPQAQDTLKKLLTLDEDTKSMTTQQYVDYVNDLLSLLAKLLDTTVEELKEKYGDIFPDVNLEEEKDSAFAQGKEIFGQAETGMAYKGASGGTLNASTAFRDMKTNVLSLEEKSQVSSWGEEENAKFKELLGDPSQLQNEEEAWQKMAEAARATIKYFDEAANAVEDTDSAIDSFYTNNQALFDEIGVGQDDFKRYVKNLQKTDKELAANTDEALALALANEKLSYAFSDLNDNLDTYQELSKETSESKKKTPEWQGQMGQAATDLKMISGVDFNTDQTQKFLQDAGNVELLKDAISGTEGALDSLYQKIIQYEGNEISGEVQNSLQAIMPQLDTTTFEGEYNQFINWIAQNRDVGDLTANADFNALPFIQHMNDAVSSAQVGAGQMKDALKALEGVGVVTEVSTETNFVPNLQKQLWDMTKNYDFTKGTFLSGTKKPTMYSSGAPISMKNVTPIQVPKLTFKNTNASGYTGSQKPSGGGHYSRSKGSGGSGSGSNKFEEDIDWIDRASKKLTDALTDIQGVVDDTFTNWDNRLKNVASEYGNLTDQINLAKQAMDYYQRRANGVGLSDAYKSKVRNGEINVETIRDENLKNLISDYQNFWDKYVQYEQQFNDLTRQRTALLEKQLDIVSGKWEDLIEDQEHISTIADFDVNTKDINAQLPAYNTKRSSTLEQLRDTMSERAELEAYIANFQGDRNSEGFHDAQKRLTDLDEKANDLRETLQDIAKQKFDAIGNQFDFLANQIDHMSNRAQSLSDIATAMGYYASNEFIKTEKQIAYVNRENSIAKRDALQRSLEEGVANGAVKEGSDIWHDMKNAIEDATDSVFEYTVAIEQANQKLRQWEWDAQDYINERTQRIFDTNQFMIDQLEQPKMFADNGGFIDVSNAQQGLHVSSYSIYLAEAKKYAKAIEDINKQLEDDPYDIELIARRETLIDQQREMIKGAKSEKEAIRDLVKNSYDTFLDYLQKLIDKRKEALDAEQDLYEYEKNVREQTKQIGSYEKQLASLQQDKSEENQLRLQELNNSLADAQEQLQETEHDRWKSDQEQMLDQMYNSFEELINTRLDDIDGILLEAIDNTNLNTSQIINTIQTTANSIGVDVNSSLNVLESTQADLAMQFGNLQGDIQNGTSTLSDVLDSQGRAIIDAGNRAALAISGDGSTTLSNINRTLNSILAAINNLKSTINSSYSSSSSDSSGKTQAGYRLYNPNDTRGNNHLFTSSEAEKDNLVKNGWNLENTGKWGSATSEGQPIYRLYNKVNGDHLYTTDANEKNSCVNSGWSFEGIVGTASGTGKPVYRLWDPHRGTHFFTSAEDEKAAVIRQGWKYEGIAWKDVNNSLFAKGGTVGDVVKRSGEDGFILARTGEEVLSLDKIEGMKKVLAMFEPLANMQQNMPNVKTVAGTSTVNVGDITTTLSLPNVENYEDFVAKAKADPKFEKLVQQMTLGNALGQSSLKKFNM